MSLLPFLLLFSAPSAAAQPKTPIISYIAGTEQQNGLYLRDLATDKTTLIPTAVENIQSYDWSPDGKHLVFNDGRDIYTIDADGTNRQQRTHSAAQTYYTAPVWSPDGTRIAYIEWGRPNRLSIIDAADTSRSITLDTSIINPPLLWSPDGRSIGYNEAGYPDPSFIIVTGLDCQAASCQHPSLHFSGILSRWSPDGKQVIVYSGKPCCVWGIDMLDLSKAGCDDPAARNCAVTDYSAPVANRHFVTDTPAKQSVVDWYGNDILFVVRSTSRSAVYTIEPDGTHLRHIVSFEGKNVSAADWSPDGQHILFQAEEKWLKRLYWANADGSHLQPVENGDQSMWGARWRPG